MFVTEENAGQSVGKPFFSLAGCFQVRFPNGIEVSAINHEAAYTEDREFIPRRFALTSGGGYTTDTIEVMVSKIEGDSFADKFFETGQVQGYVTPQEYARLLAFIANVSEGASLTVLGNIFRKG